jgi:hypothetical protein
VKKGLFIIFLFVVSALGVDYYFSNNQVLELSSTSANFDIGSYESVQKVFDQRCVQCHSCNNAPCQLKLVNYEGFARGGSKIIFNDVSRTQHTTPTRLGIDAHTKEEWGNLKFHDVNAGMLMSILADKQEQLPEKSVEEANYCAANENEMSTFLKKYPEMKMPYGLPALSANEINILREWINVGMPGPKIEKIFNYKDSELRAKTKWENYLNSSALKEKLIARYLFEHLFLASIRFTQDSNQYHRIIRSRTSCDKSEFKNEIASRRPSDDPKGNFYYCFKPLQETLMEKTLSPYTLDLAKFDRIKEIFYAKDWNTFNAPSYDIENAMNPFFVFADIPVEARYRFLLEDSEYHISTFIKGPVCNGNGAVSSISEHFEVFFIDPKSDLSVLDSEFEKSVRNHLSIPAEYGSSRSIFGTIADIKRYADRRNNYVKAKEHARLKYFPNGYSLDQIWDGDGKNINATLTVFRHSDNAYVLPGFRSGKGYSAFVLDYLLFERLVYNLVVGYDIFGNAGHQASTRIYMGLIRREAEENFLSFLPPTERTKLRDHWYRASGISKIEVSVANSPYIPEWPTQIKFKDEEPLPEVQLMQMISDKILKMNPERGLLYTDHNGESPALKSIAHKPASILPLVYGLPDISFVLVRRGGQVVDLLSLVRTKVQSSLGIFDVNDSRIPQEDMISVIYGIAGSYPNLFFVVDEDKFNIFAREIEAVHNQDDWKFILNKWAVLKNSNQFWPVSDSLHTYLKKEMKNKFGVLDYTRYGIGLDGDGWPKPETKKKK